jgi:phenylacetate-CoA ligase
MAYGSLWQKCVYDGAPPFIKNLAASVYGAGQRRARYGEAFGRHLDLLRRSQGWTSEELRAYQHERLGAFLARAVPGTPYYRGREEYRRAAATGSLDGVPLLSKREVRDHRQDFFHEEWRGMRPRTVHTSGTSGQSLVFPVTGDCFQREYAFRELHYSWGGVSLVGRQPFAFCAGHPVAVPERSEPPFWVHDRVNRHLFLSSYHLTAANLPHYVRALEAFAPVLIGGYPSSLYLLALAYRRHGTGRLRPRAVYTFSETLTDQQRSAMGDTFGCRVFNWYGNTEMCSNIVECEQGDLHLKMEHSFVEILNDRDEPCRPGESGRLVCTGFGNLAFPLIRYDIGDTVQLAAGQASRCGRGGILIDRVAGRLEDYVITPDGRLIGRLDHIFKDSAHVVEAQVVQERLEEVVLRIVPDSAYSPEDEAALLAEAERRLGPAVRVRVECVVRIPRGSTGKFRFVVSSVDRQAALKAMSLR